jgi:hypothetical protein
MMDILIMAPVMSFAILELEIMIMAIVVIALLVASGKMLTTTNEMRTETMQIATGITYPDYARIETTQTVIRDVLIQYALK